MNDLRLKYAAFTPGTFVPLQVQLEIDTEQAKLLEESISQFESRIRTLLRQKNRKSANQITESDIVRMHAPALRILNQRQMLEYLSLDKGTDSKIDLGEYLVSLEAEQKRYIRCSIPTGRVSPYVFVLNGTP